MRGWSNNHKRAAEGGRPSQHMSELRENFSSRKRELEIERLRDLRWRMGLRKRVVWDGFQRVDI